MGTMIPTSIIPSVTAAVQAADGSSPAPGEPLLAAIRSKDDKVRCAAWQKAPAAGIIVIAPLAALLFDADLEIARAAKHALETIVRHAGRPGAAAEARAVEAELIKLLANSSPVMRRQALWLLSEIGADACIEPIAALLKDAQVRDDARCVLERIPGDKAVVALRAALSEAPEEFRYALAESLRKRGQQVDGYPTRKLVPSAATKVQPEPINEIK